MHKENKGFTLIRTRLRRNLVIAHGFTLIELLIVISIIAVLASIGILTFSGAQAKARDASRKSDIKNIQNALRLYFNDYGGYPTSSASLVMMACGAGCNQTCSWNTSWTCGNQTYMNLIPKDPKGVDYHYTYVDKDNFTLDACLENTNDLQAITAVGFGANCASGKMFEVKP